jgi:hypothetical protein
MGDEKYTMVDMFALTQGELDKAEAWIKEHEQSHIVHRDSGSAIGGAYTWCFTPTSIGTVCNVKCTCGQKIDCTDYDLW